MLDSSFKTIISADKLTSVLHLPTDFSGQDVEVIVKPVLVHRFQSLSRIQIDTAAFKFNREKANAR